MNALRSFSARADIEDHPRPAGRGAARRARPAACRSVSRHGRRGAPAAHLPVGKRDRRDAVPAPRIHHSGLPAPSRHRGKPGSAAMAMSARCSGSAAPAATNSCRPASRISAIRTALRRMRGRWPIALAFLKALGVSAKTVATLGDPGRVQRRDHRARPAAGLGRAAQPCLRRSRHAGCGARYAGASLRPAGSAGRHSRTL